MIKQEKWHDVDAYRLENESLTVLVTPELGNNIFQIWDRKKQRDVLRAPDSPNDILERPSHFGTPILFPPGRIEHGTFTWEQRKYQFDLNTPDSVHHIHGFIRTVPWKVEATNIHKDGSCSIRSSLELKDFPDIIAQYPHELRLTMTVTLQGTKVIQAIDICNEGEQTAPYGLGLHTWFTLDYEPEKWELTLPSSKIWELDDDLITTGTLLSLGELEKFNQGLNLKDQDLDAVIYIGDRPVHAILTSNDTEIHYIGSDLFTQWVIYTFGKTNNFICLEPYTWVPNAPNLNLDSSLTGLQVIQPGDTVSLQMEMELIHK